MERIGNVELDSLMLWTLWICREDIMLRYKLKIELLSDMCCGSGEGNGVNQDITSGYDETGLPVIYGKRLKGLLKDKAEFLKTYSYDSVNSDLIDTVFGTATRQGLLKVGNATIEYADEIRDELQNLDEGQASYINPRSVEEVFTANRFSTEIGKNGIAKNKSLRTIGTVPKGIILYSELMLDVENKKSNEYKLLENTCKLLRGIGLNRNRGLGEVRCTLEVCTEAEKSANFKIEESDTSIDYVIELDSAVISPGDYIFGSSLQGCFINMLLKNGLIEESDVRAYLLNVKFSNAYLYHKGNKYYPMPFGMLNEKNNEDTFYSTADGYQTKDTVLYTKPKGYYYILENEIDKKTVKHHVEFHFAKKTKDIFTISGLDKGQRFSGSIYAENDDLKKIVELINKNNGVLYLGASSTAQYAKAFIKELKGKKDRSGFKDSDLSKESHEFIVVEFLSDTILVDERGINLSNKKVMENEIKKLLGEKAGIEKLYTAIVNVGGYNSKWKLPKRRYTAFSKGTQVVIKVDKGADFPEFKHGFTGLLQNEGYGEYRIRCQDACSEYSLRSDKEEKSGVALEKARGIVEKIAINRAKTECHLKAIEAVKQYLNLNKKLSASNAMKLIAGYQAVVYKKDFYDRFKGYVKTNFTEESNKDISNFAKNTITEFDKILESDGYEEEIKNALKREKDLMFKSFLETYIEYTKFQYREDG